MGRRTGEKLLRLAHERVRHPLSRTRNPLANKENKKKKLWALFCCCSMFFFFSQWQSFCIPDCLIHSNSQISHFVIESLSKLLSCYPELPENCDRLQRGNRPKQTRLGSSQLTVLREVKQTAQHRAVWELQPKQSYCSSLKSFVSCLNAGLPISF